MSSQLVKHSALVDRRWVCRAAASLAGMAVMPMTFELLPLGADDEFVIVNGWVLTRQDILGEGPSTDVA